MKNKNKIIDLILLGLIFFLIFLIFSIKSYYKFKYSLAYKVLHFRIFLLKSILSVFIIVFIVNSVKRKNLISSLAGILLLVLFQPLIPIKLGAQVLILVMIFVGYIIYHHSKQNPNHDTN